MVQERTKLVLFTDSKSQTSFRLVPKWVILNGVMVLFLRYYTECVTFES